MSEPSTSEPRLLHRVARTSVPDALYAQLRDAIVTGAYQPGDALPTERELSASSGANRLAVREAMQRLRQTGLVEIVHGGGSRVTDWRATADLSVLPDVVAAADAAVQQELTTSLARFRLVMAVELGVRLARRVAAGTIPAADLAQLQQLAATADAATGAAAVQLGDQFWDAVYDVLDDISYRLVNNTIRLTRQSASTPPARFESGAGRAAMVAAIVAGDPAAATDAVLRMFDAVL